MTARALYLDATARWQVRLDDGIALHVSGPGRARGLYPLVRLARVVSPASADWTVQALLACLKAGVPVTFHDARGDTVGWCFGPRRRETTLAALLREGLAEEEWDMRFATWRLAAERRQMLEALTAMRAHHGRLDPAAVRTRLCNLHRVRLGRPVGAHLRALQRSTAALVSEHLQREIGDAMLICFPRPGLHLGMELTALLEWPLQRLLWQTPASDVAEFAPPRFAAAALERHGVLLRSELGHLLGGLERHLRDWLW